MARIARGGMAELFRGKLIGSMGFEKIIAVKRILPHLTDQEEFVKAFIDEARLAALLQHPNIVQIYDFGEMADSYFLAMEYLSGVDLKTVIKQATEQRKPLQLSISLFYIVPQLLAGLEYAHKLKDFTGKSLNIIHRDIGPANIFVTYDGSIKIIDFGIAKASSHDTTTYAGSLKGKLAYMSPEQACGKIIDPRSDLFAVGIMLYELATGKRVYSGDTQQLLAKAAKGEYVLPEKVKLGLPPKLYSIINKSLAKDPRQRYQSAESMRLDLEACAKDMGVNVGRSQMTTYMQDLFREEAKVEMQALEDAAAYTMPVSAEPVVQQYGSDEATISQSGRPVKKEEKDLRWIVAALGAILLVGALFFWIKAFLDSRDLEPTVVNMVVDEKEPEVVTQETVVPKKKVTEKPTISIAQPPPTKPIIVNKRSEAISFFERYIGKNAKSPPVIKAADYKKMDGYAAYLLLKHPKDALDILVKMTTAYPADGHLRYYLARLYQDMRQLDRAQAAYQQTVELDPQNAKAHYNLGILYARNGDMTGAKKMWAATVSLNPDFVDEPLFNLALVAKKEGEYNKSISLLQKALQSNPANKKAAKLLKRLQAKR